MCTYGIDIWHGMLHTCMLDDRVRAMTRVFSPQYRTQSIFLTSSNICKPFSVPVLN